VEEVDVVFVEAEFLGGGAGGPGGDFAAGQGRVAENRADLVGAAGQADFGEEGEVSRFECENSCDGLAEFDALVGVGVAKCVENLRISCEVDAGGAVGQAEIAGESLGVAREEEPGETAARSVDFERKFGEVECFAGVELEGDAFAVGVAAEGVGDEGDDGDAGRSQVELGAGACRGVGRIFVGVFVKVLGGIFWGNFVAKF